MRGTAKSDYELLQDEMRQLKRENAALRAGRAERPGGRAGGAATVAGRGRGGPPVCQARAAKAGRKRRRRHPASRNGGQIPKPNFGFRF